jgi:fermentation-respiration switch protein FrsA (DUF1100 family)
VRTRYSWRAVLGSIVLVYIAFVGTLFLIQRQLLFLPDRTHTTPAENGVGDMTVIHVRTSDGLTLEGWYKPAQAGHSTIVFFHGNGGSLRHRGADARSYMDRGYGFLFAEYRGYGGNPGQPTEEGFYSDAHAYLDWLIAQGVPQNRIVLEGESLGTGVAVQMAIDYPHAAALVLNSPFTSVPDVAAKTYFFVPVHLLMRDRFDNLSLIHKVAMPVLILHGMKDEVVPYAMGKALYQAAPAHKELAVFPQGTHFNLYNLGARDLTMRFLEKYAGP